MVWRGRQRAALQHHPANWNFVLHVPHDQLYRRQLSARHSANPQFLRIRSVRLAVLAARRRTDRAVSPNRRRSPEHRPTRPNALAVARVVVLYGRSGGKGHYCGHPRRFRGSRSRQLCLTLDRWSVARHVGIQLPDLFRFFRLQQHGRWFGLSVRFEDSAKL